jgi:protein-tyrosine phosphatase
VSEERSVPQLLFLCTGNYYRSRFAEILFNALVGEHGVPWQAFSRGLALEPRNVGPMSSYAINALSTLGIESTAVQRWPIAVQENDFQAAQRIIALQEAEHRPYLRNTYPAWEDTVEYWHVHDMVPTPAYNPLQEIEQATRRFITQLVVSAGKR